jgi:hypothetical protein
MLGAEQPTGVSPKRRSTFYVSLEGDSIRKSHKSGQGYEAEVTSGYSCGGVYPISPSKTAPNVPLLARAQSTGTYRPKRSESSSLLGPKGKVQSLTRIFEGPGSGKGPELEKEQRRRVERTRSFKTIERFQSRFTARKADPEARAKSGSREPPIKAQTSLVDLVVRRSQSAKLVRAAKSAKPDDADSGQENDDEEDEEEEEDDDEEDDEEEEDEEDDDEDDDEVEEEEEEKANALEKGRQRQVAERRKKVKTRGKLPVPVQPIIDGEAKTGHNDTDTDAGVHSGRCPSPLDHPPLEINCASRRAT